MMLLKLHPSLESKIKGMIIKKAVEEGLTQSEIKKKYSINLIALTRHFKGVSRGFRLKTIYHLSNFLGEKLEFGSDYVLDDSDF